MSLGCPTMDDPRRCADIICGYPAAYECFDGAFHNLGREGLSDRQYWNLVASSKVIVMLISGTPCFSRSNVEEVVTRYVESEGRARTLFRWIIFRDGELVAGAELFNSHRVAEVCQLTKRDASRAMDAYRVPRERIGRENYVLRTDAEALARRLAGEH